MTKSPQLVSPKQVARAIGVSESSLKRWCDQGLIKTVRTAGGHRKMDIAEVLRYVREQDHKLVSPEILGLPPASEHASTGLTHGGFRLVDALLSGDELVARQIVFDLYLAKHSRSVIFDEVIAAAFREIGDRWECHEAEVYQERRGCEIALRVLFDLRRVQQVPERKWLATGGTIEGDQYSLPSAMAELVLRDCWLLRNLAGYFDPVCFACESGPRNGAQAVLAECVAHSRGTGFRHRIRGFVASVCGGRHGASRWRPSIDRGVAATHDLFGILRHHATPGRVRHNTAPLIDGRTQNKEQLQAAEANSRITEVREMCIC